MKKNTSFIIVAVVVLTVGYFLGANLGTGDGNLIKGDINAVNTHHQLLTDPEYMAFDKSMAGNEEAVSCTISTLQIVERRILDFATLAGMVKTVSVDDAEVTSSAEQLLKTVADGQKVLTQTRDALEAAVQLKAGQKADHKARMAELDVIGRRTPRMGILLLRPLIHCTDQDLWAMRYELA